jgi:hypothetical protein
LIGKTGKIVDAAIAGFGFHQPVAHNMSSNIQRSVFTI